MPCNDCSRAEDCPPCVNEPKGPDDSSTNPQCGCGHLRSSHFNRDEDTAYCIGNRNLCPCDGFEFQEPPLAPEEEEQAPCAHESWDVTSEWYDHLSMKWHKARRCHDCGDGLDVVFEDEPHFPDSVGKGPEPSEPQPLRRPPNAVAYSVAGHLYEIALPGDATVQATDGALIITHTLGPVAGVVRVHPIEGEQS